MAIGTENEDIRHGIVEQFSEYLREYEREGLAELAQRYPSDKEYEIDWMDLFMSDDDLAHDYLESPRMMHKQLEAAIPEVSLPQPGELDDVNVRVVNAPDRVTYSPAAVAKVSDEDPGYIAVQGQLSKVTTPAKKMVEIAYECNKCGRITRVQQPSEEIEEPHECSHCERQGPFEIDHSESIRQPHVRLRIEAPPNEKGKLTHEEIDAIATDDIVWTGHEEFGIAARSGEPVTVYGTVEMEQIGNSTLFTERLRVWAIEFQNERETVDVSAHREEFQELAAREDAVDTFKESIVPELYATPEWDHALELLVAYLFGSPRVDVEGGPTYRGDIHALIVSDYGMGKSMVNEAVAEFSPDCIKESVTGLSSDVGLLAAAVKDDFGQGESWTLEPGILVRGNGGHVILDEIDKTDADLERMNDALEGEQMVDINKAGQSATFKSRVGLLATGNPSGSRFDRNDTVGEQLDLDESLLSRFDGIVTMRDTPDEETDAAVAQAHGQSWIEAHEYQYGDREELDTLDREVCPDVGRAWVAYAREHVQPGMPAEYSEEIEQWYAEEIRPLNKKFATDEGVGADMPVPANARAIGATIRFACAFARVHLRDRVQRVDVERAMELSETLIGQTFDSETGQFVTHEVQVGTQQERVDTLRNTLAGMEPDDTTAGVPKEKWYDAVPESIGESEFEHEVEQLRQKGEIYEPATDEYRTT